MTEPLAYYTSALNKYSQQLKEVRQQATNTTIARLAAFLLLAYGIYAFANNKNSTILVLDTVALVAFIALVRHSVFLNDKRKLLTQLVFLNTNEIDVLNHATNAFDDGTGIPDTAMHAADLDIFGHGSVYHVLNRTTTIHGRDALAGLLNHPVQSKEGIRALQDAVSVLAGQPEVRQLITANGLLLEKDDGNIGDIFKWMETPDKMLGSPLLTTLRFVLPAISIFGLFYYLSSDNPIFLGTGIILSWITIGRFAKYTMQQHQLIGKKEQILQQYGTILKTFSSSQEDHSVLLKETKIVCSGAQVEIIRLSKLSSWFDQRLNLLVATFLNSLFLYDIHVMIALEKWKKRNRGRFAAWVEAVGAIEKLNSLATFSFNNPHYCKPAILDGRPAIHAISVSHPLIPSGHQVANDLDAGASESLLLITGSNMSGKSTFLRTIGVNLLLAQCGLPVCAGQFSFTPMHILSSIRINDSLQENTSYFMAELKRLKQIIDIVSSSAPALVLIDEVLRGTNSDDKTFGSEELIKKLSAFNCLSLFASHDLSLSILEKTLPGKVKNYCFESSIIDGELLFDYKLRSGVATNKNASFLMKKMGIIG